MWNRLVTASVLLSTLAGISLGTGSAHAYKEVLLLGGVSIAISDDESWGEGSLKRRGVASSIGLGFCPGDSTKIDLVVSIDHAQGP